MPPRKSNPKADVGLDNAVNVEVQEDAERIPTIADEVSNDQYYDVSDEHAAIWRNLSDVIVECSPADPLEWLVFNEFVRLKLMDVKHGILPAAAAEQSIRLEAVHRSCKSIAEQLIAMYDRVPMTAITAIVKERFGMNEVPGPFQRRPIARW